jgi:serine/threonine protein kinase
MHSSGLNQCLDDFRQRWERGERTRVEDYLKDRQLDAWSPDNLLDLIYLEVILREEIGEAPTLEEYMGRFPHLAKELEMLFEVHQATAPSPDGGADAVSFPSMPGYIVLEQLGQGGFGIVYRAQQTSLHREVALKLLRNWSSADAVEWDRLREEARANARLNHPSIVQIHDVLEYQPPGGGRPLPVLCLEYVEGGNLDDKLQGRPLAPSAGAAMTETLARAVAYLHQRRLVHCDLKPANVLLDPAGEHPAGLGTPKLTDFGFARWTDPESERRKVTVGGTASYMAPEQASRKAGKIGPATDVYALGAILYKLLTGQPPFVPSPGATTKEVLAQLLSHEPVSPKRLQPRVPRNLELICLKCLHKQPPRRYASAEELADELRCFLNNEPLKVTRPVGRLERLWLWCRRYPVVAGLAIALTVAILAGSTGVTVKAVEASNRAADAEKAAKEAMNQEALAQAAKRQTEAEKEKLAQLFYHYLIVAAERAIASGRWAEAQGCLADCPRELRNFEWHMRRSFVEGSQLTLRVGGLVTAAAFSADGRLLITNGGPELLAPVRIWQRRRAPWRRKSPSRSLCRN